MFKNWISCFVLLLLCQLVNGQTYQSAESVEYDPANNRFLISNGSNILARASDGTLSFFGTGSTSYGLEVMGDYVFGISGSSIKGFDLTTEAEVMSISIPGAAFLNGLTNDGSALYATDFGNNTIHKIDVSDLNNPSSQMIVSNTVRTPNGIVYDGTNDRLIYVTWGGNADIRAVELSDNSISVVATTTYSNIDGIDDDVNQNYYIASWTPAQITKYDSNFQNPTIITTPALSGPADIGYAQAIDTLGIPQGNKVDYIGFEVMTSTEDLLVSDFGLTAYPNPIQDQSWIQFELEKSAVVDLAVYDLQGRFVYQLLQGQQSHGQHKVLLNGVHLPKGMYTCILKVIDQGKQSPKMGNISLIVN